MFRHLTFYFILSYYSSVDDDWIKVITKLPNSEQSYKGKVKTEKMHEFGV
jgi:hypothetical protein